MEINLSKLAGGVVGVLALACVGFTIYLIYALFFVGPEIEANPSVASIAPSSFEAKLQKAAKVLTDATQKIAVSKKDLSYTDSALYKSFVDLPEVVPLSDERGRPDPFIPYVAP